MSVVKPVEQEKMLMLVTVLSDYDFFRIEMETGKKFYSTRIETFQYSFLVFRRLFSVLELSDDKITSIKANTETEFVCTTPKHTYTIFALHKKPDYIAEHIERSYRSIVDLMDVNFIGSRFTKYQKETDSILLVVDPYCIGEMTSIQEMQIARVIDFEFGKNVKYRMCRTICFQVPMDGSNELYVGIYDLENMVPALCDLIYDDSMDGHVSEELKTKSMALIRLAKEAGKNF